MSTGRSSKRCSITPQTVVLELPAEIAQLSVSRGVAKIGPAGRDSQRTLALSGGQPATLVIGLK